MLAYLWENTKPIMPIMPIEVFDVALVEWRGNSWSVGVVAFSSDRSLLASGSSDDTVGLWDLIAGADACKSEKCIRSYPEASQPTVTSE